MSFIQPYIINFLRMKVFKISLLAFVLVFLQISVNCQDNNNCSCKENLNIVPENEELLFGKAFYNRFVGKNVQFFYNWAVGDVYLTDSSIVKNKYLRYNGLIDEVLWMRNSDYQIAVLDRKRISKIVIKGPEDKPFATFVKVNHKNIQFPQNDDMYLQLLAEGQVSLYKKIEIVENKSNGELIRRDLYFLQKDSAFHSFQMRRSFFIQSFGDDKKTIRHILRSNFLSVRNESNLIRAIEIYNLQIGNSK